MFGMSVSFSLFDDLNTFNEGVLFGGKNLFDPSYLFEGFDLFSLDGNPNEVAFE